jgi:Arc/MetJ-type ribon-helix-helix transcriptional regulator
MTRQIAIRIPDQQLEQLDKAVERGEFGSRSEAMRHALSGLLAELRERGIAREYREAYGRQPQGPEIGRAGAKLLADFYEREEPRSE